ncbi:MAG: 23S rRNA (guanosine(2251)-2'-O)-methyltransferase RlmB [Myxococcales bacterium]|nr:MAG: 23S rRNA (guanosine(2251)-2'-O)-methyltransferase RlmB [Myxococcales bacterium]
MKRRVYGKQAVREAMRGRAPLHILCVSEKATQGLTELLDLAKHQGVELRICPESQLDALAQGGRHQGVVGIGGEFPYLDLEVMVSECPNKSPFFIALDELTDPHNFGAIVRTAVCLGLDGMIIPRHRAAPVSGAVVRAAAGATEHARIARVTNLGKALCLLRENYGFEIVGLDAASDVQINSINSTRNGQVLVVGSEGKGLRRLVREACDVLVRIDMAGPVASLNASVAAAIAMYQLNQSKLDNSQVDNT